MSLVTDDVDLKRDRQLVERCQAGDADAFGELYRIYHQRVVRHCARRLGGRANAEDVAQEAFIRAWRAIDRLEGHRGFYPWLHVIASNACTDVLRRQRPTMPLSDVGGVAELDDRPGVEDHVTAAFDAALATGAMGMLSDRHRRVLHLREQLEWSVQDIAAHEGIEANAVDTLLWRARASLRRQFRALSEGVAAVIAVGRMRVLLARNRIVHLAHKGYATWGSSLRARAALATVVLVGAGTAASPLVWSHPARAQIDPGARPVAAVTHGSTGGPPVAGTSHSVAPTVASPGGSTSSPSGSPTAMQPGAGSTGAGGTAPPGSSGLPAGPSGSGSSNGFGGSPTPVTLPSGGAAAGVLPAATGVVNAATGVVAGTVQGVGTVTGGLVQSTLASPVVPPVLKPVTGGGATATAGGTKGVLGVVEALGGLGTR